MIKEITIGSLTRVLDVLVSARRNLDYEDYKNIWGGRLGGHIWRQEGNDLLKIWTSGLTPDQKDQFVRYLLKGKEWINK